MAGTGAELDSSRRKGWDSSRRRAELGQQREESWDSILACQGRSECPREAAPVHSHSGVWCVSCSAHCSRFVRLPDTRLHAATCCTSSQSIQHYKITNCNTVTTCSASTDLYPGGAGLSQVYRAHSSTPQPAPRLFRELPVHAGQVGMLAEGRGGDGRAARQPVPEPSWWVVHA